MSKSILGIHFSPNGKETPAKLSVEQIVTNFSETAEHQRIVDKYKGIPLEAALNGQSNTLVDPSTDDPSAPPALPGVTI